MHILARVYVTGANCAPTDHELTTLNKWIESEFNSIPCKVKFWTGDITLAECKAEFNRTGILNISTAHNNHPYLSKSMNAKFRAVHDWAHLQMGADDSFAGEFSTWWANNAPDCIQWILFSEIVLQAAANITTGEFQPQKLVRALEFAAFVGAF